MLDVEKLDRLLVHLPFESVRDLACLFIDDSDGHIGRISQRGDLKSVGFDAHALVSTSGNIGAMRISALAGALERACRAEDGARVEQLTLELLDANAMTVVAIRKWIEGHSPGQEHYAVAG